MSKNPIQVISEDIAKGRQDVVYEKIFSMLGQKLKIRIVSDSHKFQSSAKIQIFNPEKLEWNLLHSIHYSKMQTPEKLYYKYHNPSATPSKDEFTADINSLTKMAEAILC